MKILVVDDELLTREGLAKLLAAEGYQVTTAEGGAEALAAFERECPDIVILDIMMPGMDGFTVCREIRRKDDLVPIFFLSAKSTEIDKVVGIELGADDFIVKPFSVREVIARIRTTTRRLLAIRRAGAVPTSAPALARPHSFGMRDLEVFPLELRARRGETTADLSLREVHLLELFYRNPGRVLDRVAIADACWGNDRQPTSRTIDQHIAMLRKKIEPDPAVPTIIKTVHGAGYRFDP